MKLHLTASPAYDESGNYIGKMSDNGIRISNLPRQGVQRIHVDLLKGPLEGKHTKTDTHITVHTKDGDVSFRIDQEPGRYCLTCGERLADFAGNGSQAEAEAAQECRDHVKGHGSKAETSEKWPYGYQSHPRSYICTIEENNLSKRLMSAGA
jgi:hypothetical protein